MPNQQLLDYINQARQKGISNAQIRQELLGAGWPEREVDQGLELPELPTRRSHKKVIITILIMVLILALGIGGYFGYSYWQKGQPAHSLNQFQIAFQEQDTISVQKYIDMDVIFNNFWPRYKAKVKDNNVDYSSSLLSAALKDTESDLRDAFRNSLYDLSRGKKGDSSLEILTQLLLTQLFEIKNPQFTINGDTAILKMDFKRDTKNYNFDIILIHQTDRTWKITDIQGIEDVIEYEFLSKGPRDKTRISIMRTLAVTLELYFDDHNNEYPSSLDSLTTYFKDGKVPTDPLDNKPYEYSHSVSNGKILYYHLGASLEDKINAVLDSDADCYSTSPSVNCPSSDNYINGFNGSDAYGCNGETGRACYDLTKYQ